MKPIGGRSHRPLETQAKPPVPLSGCSQLQTLVGQAFHLRREEAELTLLRNQELLQAVFAQSPLGIAFLGPEGQFIAVNRALCRVFDYTEADIRTRSLIEVSHPDDGPAMRDWIVSVFGGAPARESHEHSCIRRDGERLWVRIHLSAPCYSLDGRPFVVAIVEDVSERKRIQAELAHAQKIEALGQLAGGIAHDFNNLLTVITGYTDQLLRELPLGSELRGKALILEKAAASASALTGQLLTFSHKQARQPRPIDLNETLRLMSGMLARLLAEHIEIRTLFPPDLGVIEADPTQVEQIVINLAVNARDAMPHSGVLTVETANVERNGPHVMLSVTDTGHGMDTATLSRIFEPFFTTKEQGRGTGMGLPTVYDIVKQSGGDIEVDSTPGWGTQFRIYLPRIAQGPEARTPESPVADYPGTGTVLLVEDAQLVRTLVSEVLRGSGYTVLEASDGVEALEAAAHHAGSIDLLVSDVVMPRMNGSDLFRRISAAHPAIKVLFVSAHSGYLLDEVARLRPGAGFLQKPFTPDALLRKVRSILAGGGTDDRILPSA